MYGVQLATIAPTVRSSLPARPRPSFIRLRETDVYAPAGDYRQVTAGMKGSNNEVEIYPGTHHGFAFTKRPVYNRTPPNGIGAAARALSRNLV